MEGRVRGEGGSLSSEDGGPKSYHAAHVVQTEIERTTRFVLS